MWTGNPQNQKCFRELYPAALERNPLCTEHRNKAENTHSCLCVVFDFLVSKWLSWISTSETWIFITKYTPKLTLRLCTDFGCSLLCRISEHRASSVEISNLMHIQFNYCYGKDKGRVDICGCSEVYSVIIVVLLLCLHQQRTPELAWMNEVTS